MATFSRLLPWYLIADLRRHKQSATFNRLGTSQHVADLRLIFAATLGITIVSVSFAFVYNLHTAAPYEALGDIGPFAAAIGAVACSVSAWVYLTASVRLGVVDLFACEISTLTRVGTIVDVAPRLTALDASYNQLPSQSAADGHLTVRAFSSAESYFPVFDTTIKDLQQLEADVVQHVTAFYTYSKTMRDYMRRLSDIQPGQPDSQKARASTVTDIIYMLFLAYESARHAIYDLVEYVPERDECTIAIYLTELKAYHFLTCRFSDEKELRHRRLKARRDPYISEIAELATGVETETAPAWAAARELLIDLMTLSHEIFGEQAIEEAKKSKTAERAIARVGRK